MMLLNILKEKLKEEKNKKGFIAIETVIALTVVIIFILLFIGFYIYLYPRIVLEKEVHTLAQQAKITGGLTQPQVQEFNKAMDTLGYTVQSLNVSTTNHQYAENGSASGLVNVYPKGGPCTGGSQNFIKRTESEKLIITVKVKANNFIKGPLSFFGTTNSLSKTYNITETVMSERNKC